MNPYKVTIAQLFSLQCRHIVPIFQRRYVWGEQQQWAPLWEDVLQKCTELLEPGRTPRKHFMGAVVLRPLPPRGLEYQSYDVIDGQQRLTTLQILLIALRDVALSYQVDPVVTMIGGMITNPKLNNVEYEQWKVVPTSSDRTAFKHVWEAGSPEELLRRQPPIRQKYARIPDSSPAIVEAYRFFSTAIRRFVETNTDISDDPTPVDLQTTTTRLVVIAQALTQQFELVRIDLDNDDDPQVIFETLNYNGVRLLPGDLVRNYVFLEAARQYGSHAQIQTIYDDLWSSYDLGQTAVFWREQVRQGRLTNQRFELFLFHFLTSQIKRPDDDIQLGHLYQAFSKWWGQGANGGRDVIAALKTMRQYSDFYWRLFAHNDSDRVSVFGRRIRTMDVSTILPLVLFLGVERAEETEQELDGILEDLESYLIRRMICGLTTKGYNRIFVKLMTDLRKGIVSRAAVRQHLSGLTGLTAAWPTDEEFKQAWMTSRIYENRPQARIVMVLEAIDWAQYGSFQEIAHPPSGTVYSIEHILPQNPFRQDWPLNIPEDADENTRLNAMLTRDTLRQTFGNLTLVTMPLNLLLSNGPFENKRAHLTQQSTLMLNKYFLKHGTTTWDESQIRTRGERLYAHAAMLWPHS